MLVIWDAIALIITSSSCVGADGQAAQRRQIQRFGNRFKGLVMGMSPSRPLMRLLFWCPILKSNYYKSVEDWILSTSIWYSDAFLQSLFILTTITGQLFYCSIYKSNHYSSFKGRAPVGFIYGFSIHQINLHSRPPPDDTWICAMDIDISCCSCRVYDVKV